MNRYHTDLLVSVLKHGAVDDSKVFFLYGSDLKLAATLEDSGLVKPPFDFSGLEPFRFAILTASGIERATRATQTRKKRNG